MKRVIIIFCICLALVLGFSGVTLAAQTGDIGKVPPRTMALEAPETGGGMPLLEAVSLRKSERGFSAKALSDQDLSNILWVAWGYNRPDEKKRTVPTSHNRQEMELYAVLASGVWRYNADDNALEMVLDGNMLERFGGAPLTLLYAGPPDKGVTRLHAGSMYQNVGLYCAAKGLGNVVKTSGTDALKDELKLPAGYAVVIVQSIGMLD